jgi:hypothetical protein
MLDRLNELSVFGCDPTDFQDWLEEITAPEPHRTQGSFEVDGFDIGNVSRKHKGGDELQLKAAYRAIRFIEDAGIPLEVPETVTMSVASKLFRQAMKVIAYFAPHEAVGLFLRARNQDLTKEVLSRKCLATLSENRFNTLFDTARNGIYDAFSRLGSTTIPSERDNEYWREQARVACLALDRAVVRIKDELFGALFSRLVNLQRQPATRDWRIGEGLHECVSRVASLLPKASLEELLPTLLTIPVPGSAESGVPQNVSIDWHDPVIVVMNYRWQPDGDAVARCSRQIEDILSRAAVAQGGERAVLCRRCVYLMEAGILSVTQRQKLAASLFAQTDTNGLPKDTGCFDSLVLSFSSREDFDEVAAFRAKYLTSDSDSVWLALRKTNTGVLNLRSDDRRKLNWSRADLTAILVMAERWIIGKTPPTQSAPPHPFAVMFGRAENLGMAFLDWLATLENVVLLNPRANRAHREKANELIVKAEGFGWCVTQTGPTRVLFNYESPAKAISSMRFYLGDRDAFNVRQACDAIVRWYELGKTSGLSVPTSVPQMLWTLLAERRHEYLSLLISTCKGVIERTDQRTCSTFLTAINSTMQQLLVETTYSYPSGEDTLGWRPSADEGAFSMPMKLRIRVACAKLVRTARRAGLCVPFVEQWSAALQSDLFADVRREYEYDH